MPSSSLSWQQGRADVRPASSLFTSAANEIPPPPPGSLEFPPPGSPKCRQAREKLPTLFSPVTPTQRPSHLSPVHPEGERSDPTFHPSLTVIQSNQHFIKRKE